MSRAQSQAAYYLRRKAQRRLLAHNRAVLAQPALLTDRIQPLRYTPLKLKKKTP